MHSSLAQQAATDSSRDKNHQSSQQAVVQKRAVSFGNPALGTYHGYVYTTNHLISQLPLELLEQLQGVAAIHHDRLIAMVNVPPAQVPEGILHAMAPFSSWIVHVRIVIEDKQQGNTIGTESSSFTSSKPSAIASDGEAQSGKGIDHWDSSYNDRSSSTAGEDQLHTTDRSYLVLIEFVDEETASSFVQDVHNTPYTSLDDSFVCSVCHVGALEGINGVSVMSPLFAATTTSSTATASMDNSSTAVPPTAKQRFAEDYNCAVCLEHMDLIPTLTATTTDDSCYPNQQQLSPVTSILTTVCNHSFHMPCLEKWQDSPCPVCRYDHSGLNEALSRCHECGTTENNYVCLICGVVSCCVDGGGGMEDVSLPHVCSRAADATSVSPSVHSHARRHYDETLHAYALHTESQHVWDFAGQGYVHRLLQNKEDGKLVEVNDPQNTSSQERTMSPGLSEAQEGEVVHRKLKGFASQYYTLLKSQLEQQRIYFEGQLEEIRREHTDSNKERKSLTTADLVAALRAERSQLSHRLETLKARNAKATEDLSFIVNLNDGLEANREPLRQQVQQAQLEQLEQRQMFESCLPQLQEKVTRLMLQLETAGTTSDVVGDDRKLGAKE